MGGRDGFPVSGVFPTRFNPRGDSPRPVRSSVMPLAPLSLAPREAPKPSMKQKPLGSESRQESLAPDGGGNIWMNFPRPYGKFVWCHKTPPFFGWSFFVSQDVYIYIYNIYAIKTGQWNVLFKLINPRFWTMIYNDKVTSPQLRVIPWLSQTEV